MVLRRVSLMPDEVGLDSAPHEEPAPRRALHGGAKPLSRLAGTFQPDRMQSSNGHAEVSHAFSHPFSIATWS